MFLSYYAYGAEEIDARTVDRAALLLLSFFGGCRLELLSSRTKSEKGRKKISVVVFSA